MVVFIAGKITGDENYKEKFAKAEGKLQAEGHVVLNPAVLPKGLYYGDYFVVTQAMIDISQAIYLLKDAKDSKGAMREYKYAMKQFLDVMEEE